MNDKVLEGFKKDFLSIKAKGFVESRRQHDTGIGKTFEDLIGIIENNNFLADYKGVLELKSSRELSESMVTLFTKCPTYPRGVNSVLRERFGQPDPKANGLKTLHTTFSAVKFNSFVDKYGFKLEVDEANKKIFILVKDLQNNQVQSLEIYYVFDVLKRIIGKKCDCIAYIKTDSKKEDGKEFFNFRKAFLLSGLTFDKFIELVKEGIILYDIRIGVYRSGKNMGKTHDHGSGFRVLKNNINKIFKVEEI